MIEIRWGWLCCVVAFVVEEVERVGTPPLPENSNESLHIMYDIFLLESEPIVLLE
jgi:hypothetical protein